MTMRSIAILAAVLAAVPVLAQAADVKAGRGLAVAKCQTCHGLNGIATIAEAPHLAGESEIYLETQLRAFRSGKRQQEMMSIVAKDLTDEEIANLAAWYAAIRIEATMPE
ncbi:MULTISPECIES: c-type cytochrome [Chelatococcus]|uniref:Cytochrome c553 n=1 Tax=Chelatococcus caeni TaxID=1348468 RepID=A0A840BPY6_9HYPH|nr:MULTISPECIES: c-type cytochrome [Chelatococcus]ALA18376.1 cytochrome C554 [Chelatococcus sp. CO-6]MBB4015531.1 cytochrome c553 [Chelatococcus caeni]